MRAVPAIRFAAWPQDADARACYHLRMAGKVPLRRNMRKRLRLAIFQVEAVMKMLSSDVNLRLIAPKRRNTGNPWFKRGTLYRAVIDTPRKATGPMTADDICMAL